MHRGCWGASCIRCHPQWVEITKRMIQEGNTVLEVAATLGVSHVTVHNLMHKHLPELQGQMRATQRLRQGQAGLKAKPADDQEMQTLSAQGYGIDWIGKKLGFHGTTVRYRLLKLLGVAEYKRRHARGRYCGGPKGYRKNSRGDLVQSSYEEAVADFLHQEGVAYQMHSTLTHEGRRFFPDFYLPAVGLYIEVLGLTDLAYYRRKVQEKKRAYQAMKVACIWIDKCDVDKGLTPRMQEVLRARIH